jgi:alpha-mannosidase/mannosylglycerate hydrolase
MLPDLPREMLGYHVNAVSWKREGACLSVCAVAGSEPRGAFDHAAAKQALAAALAEPFVSELTLELRRSARLRVAFTDDLPGHGLRVYRLATGVARGSKRLESGRLAGGGAFVESEAWRVEASADGSVTLTHRESGSVIQNALRIVSEGDRGDTYNFDPVPGAASLERPQRARVRVERASASAATLAVELRLRIPLALEPDRAHRSAKQVELPITLRLRVLAGLDRVDVLVHGDNTAQDHRLRIQLRAPFLARCFEVESAFETVERSIAPTRDSFGSAQPAEFPIGSVPQRSFASISDGVRALTVAARGSSEVEAVPEPDSTTSLAVTLLRAVGWLSCSDLSLRPGPAGPMFPTPGAQVPGPFVAELSLRLHAAGEISRVAEAHRFAWPAAAFALGEGVGAALRDGTRLLEIDDPAIVVSALEPGPEGTLRVRLYEATGRPRRLRGRIPGATQILALDLTGRPDTGLSLETSADAFEAELRPGQLVDLEVHFAPATGSTLSPAVA